MIYLIEDRDYLKIGFTNDLELENGKKPINILNLENTKQKINRKIQPYYHNRAGFELSHANSKATTSLIILKLITKCIQRKVREFGTRTSDQAHPGLLCRTSLAKVEVIITV